MGKPKVEKFSLTTIAATVNRLSDVEAARSVLPFAVGAVLNVSGKVQKVVKRDGQMKLVIEPDNVPGFLVFADCFIDAEEIKARKIRKNSLVSVRGRLQSFGNRAVCLSLCRLQ